MDSLAIVLIALAAYCNEVYCDTLPVTVVYPEDAEYGQRNDSRTTETGPFDKTLWSNFSLSRRRAEEPRSLMNGMSGRKSRLLGSLAFLAGLSFGGLAGAASSTVKSIAKLPQAASISLNLGPNKGSPFFAAYYNPYSLLPYPFLYPFGLPTVDPAKLQPTSHNEPTAQVISVFDNGRPIDLADGNDEYADDEKPDGNQSGNGAPDRRAELRAGADRHAEEKTATRGCKEDRRKHGDHLRGSTGRREDHQVDANQPRQILNPPAANATGVDGNGTATGNATTASPPAYYPPYYDNRTRLHYHHHFPGYYGGHPQDVSHVDLTTDAHQYHDHGQPIDYHPPHYEQPASFYHGDKYATYAHVNPYHSGSYAPDQINEYAGTDFSRRIYASEYQPSYSNGFKPAK